MANISLRNPQYVYKEVPATGVLSQRCEITFNQEVTPEYTIVKNVAPSTTAYWDISELARDFLDIQYKANFIASYIVINVSIENFAGLNGTGGVVGTATTFTNTGFESYGTFEQGVNPLQSEPFKIFPTFLISADTSVTPPTFTIYAPTGAIGTIPWLLNNGFPASVSYAGNSTGVIISGAGQTTTCQIKRIDCTKYGLGRKIIFINKYGAQQELWFFLKETKAISRTNEGYKSNTLVSIAGNNPPAYDIQNAPNKVFNTQAKNNRTLSSGYYPEQANDFFEELLLSEYVWMEIVKDESSPIQNEIIPVKVKTSSISFKTSLNDKLIEYTIEFEDAFDYINNIR